MYKFLKNFVRLFPIHIIIEFFFENKIFVYLLFAGLITARLSNKSEQITHYGIKIC